MESLSQALMRVREGTQYFAAEPALRLLHVRVDGSLRHAALELVAASESLSENRNAFFFFETPVEAGDAGWAGRIEELQEDWKLLGEALAEQGVSLPPWRAPIAHGSALERFVATVLGCGAQLPPPAAGINVVFAPLFVGNEARWREDVASLLQNRKLDKVRFVIVETDAAPTRSFVESLGDALALGVDASVSEEDTARDLDAMTSAMGSAPTGSMPERLMGGAGPSVAPPPRGAAMDKASLEALAASLGIAAGMLDMQAMQSLRHAIFSSSLAMRRGEHDKAIDEQTRAAGIARNAGMDEPSLVMELIAGSTRLQAGQTREAHDAFASVRDRAMQNKLMRVATQAEMSRASALMLLKQPDLAAQAYEAAARIGQVEIPELAIEAYRVAGQVHAQHKRLEPATKDFNAAIALAKKSPPEVAAASTAPQAARDLAALLRANGMLAQAASLEEQARALEAGPAPEGQNA